jgi:hypothetical protein
LTDIFLLVAPVHWRLCGFEGPRRAVSQPRCDARARRSQVSGGYSEGETPLPFPNRAVKPLSADGTWPARAWESRSPPVFSVPSPVSASGAGGALSYFFQLLCVGGGWRSAAVLRARARHPSFVATAPRGVARRPHAGCGGWGGVRSAESGTRPTCLLRGSPRGVGWGARGIIPR